METGPRLVSLELGGKNAMVVLRRRRPRPRASTARSSVPSAPSGQRCTSTSRLHRAPRRRRRASSTASSSGPQALRARRPARRPTPTSGPVITAESAERIVGDGRRRAVAEGATVATGGRRRDDVDGCEGGTFVEPTILTGVKPTPPHRPRGGVRPGALGARGRRPRRGDRRRQLRRVRAVGRGLHAATSTPRCTPSTRIDTGIVYVNAPTIGAEIPLPFGGTKHTGNGFREAGARGIEQFSQVKTVYVDYSGRLQRAQIDNRGGGRDDHRSTHRPPPTTWLARVRRRGRRRCCRRYFDVVAERGRGLRG